MDENSFAPVPEAISAATEPVSENVLLTATAQQCLYQTVPWIRFFFFLLLITSGLVMLAGVLVVLMVFWGRFTSPGPLQGMWRTPGGTGLVLLGLFCFQFAFLAYILPAIFLYRHSGAFKTLRSDLFPFALDEAMKHQRTFWRYLGIITSIIIALWLLIGIAAGFITVFVALRSIKAVPSLLIRRQTLWLKKC